MGKIKNAVKDKDAKWVEKMKYKPQVNTSDAGVEAKKADKAFKKAMVEIDKASKKRSQQKREKELAQVEQKAKNETATEKKVEDAAAKRKLEDTVTPNLAEREMKEKMQEEEQKKEEQQVDSDLAAEEVVADDSDKTSAEMGNLVYREEIADEGTDSSAKGSDSHDSESAKDDADSADDSAALSFHWHKVETDSPEDIMSDIFGDSPINPS